MYSVIAGKRAMRMEPLTEECAGVLRADRNNRLFVQYIILAAHRA
jgi:hypothetical protein